MMLSFFDIFVSAVLLIYRAFSVDALGSSSTLAVVDSSSSPTVCGIVSGSRRYVSCYSGSRVFSVLPNVSYSSIAGGDGLLCGLIESSRVLVCWDGRSNFSTKRLYHNVSAPLRSIAVGSSQICGLHNRSNTVQCWRSGARRPTGSVEFFGISSGSGFSCGILSMNRTVQCWGVDNVTASLIQSEFSGREMTSIACGGAHACGLDASGVLLCKGSNSSGQLNVPAGATPFEFSDVSLGSSHSCAIRAKNGTVDCWGEGFNHGDYNVSPKDILVIASGNNFSCGILSGNLSVACWGAGWPGSGFQTIPFTAHILPGPCVAEDSCDSGIVANSLSLCAGSGVVCQSCSMNVSLLSPKGETPRAKSNSLNDGLLIFSILGSVGILFGILTILYLAWTGVCCGKKKVVDSVQPTVSRGSSKSRSSKSNSEILFSRSSTLRKLGSKVIHRRSGISSTDAAEVFSFIELAVATNGFSLENKIGAGSFGVVYKGKLGNGREVAIKRGEIASNNKARKTEEKVSAFESEISFLSRLHHKHLVRLVGFCEDGEERLLVYEYMTNGALFNHLHDKETPANSRVATSWKMRIKLALDAARGIEYLHTYAVPPIIHRDIKSSNILIDSNWTARVSDFGLSLIGSEQSQPMKTAGTIGYIDPEYYGLNVLTVKSDVYGFGVVLLEIITGRRAIFKGSFSDDDDGAPVSLVDYAVPMIMANELGKFLDPKVGIPTINEAEAVELVANTAVICVHLEGKERPTMTDIVGNLERALSICEDSSHDIMASD